MRLYGGTATDFIEDSVQNRIADKLRTTFFYNFRHEASPGEINSWRNSLRAMAQVFQAAKLEDHGVLLEYQLPLTSKRLDCLVTGRNELLADRAVIVELKQWEKCEAADGDKIVTFVGGNHRDVLHPSVQVGHYQQYLEDCHTAFYEGESPIGLRSCAYLHNYSFHKDEPLLSPKFKGYFDRYPLFSADDVNSLVGFLQSNLIRGGGMDILGRIEESKYRPSKKLLDHVGQVVEGKPEYVLLDEQIIAFDRVLTAAKEGFKDKRKSVILVRGGPGTGKSVIALNLLGALSKAGLNAHYVTGSKAFTTTLREIVGTRAARQVRYFNQYTDADFNVIDVMICDEAHRIRITSNNRFTPKAKKSNKLQVEELLHASKVAVFFVDDKQVVKPDEIGSAQYILDKAAEAACRVYDYKLEAQFRCSGSDGFINWVNNTLEVERTPNVLWNLSEQYEFRIFDTPAALESAIVAKHQQKVTARLSAGFCWPWSKPKADGTLVSDVKIGDFERPWNARPDAGRLATGIPPAPLWAYDANGINQVGCVYTAQGFEFDYVGVIFGNDFVYRHGKGWVGQKEHSEDTTVKRSREKFIDLVKNTYRVLLTRGMKGCYVYFMDEETRQFFHSRTEKVEIKKD